MSTINFRTLIAFVTLASCLGARSSQALVLDWSTMTWTAGSLTNSYDIDPANGGNDVTVTVSGNTGQFQPELGSGAPMTPAITNNFQGGNPSPVPSLSLALNLANQSQFVGVAVNFSAAYTLGVTNVSFQLFDVDFDNGTVNATSFYQDLISNIHAIGVDGITLIAPTITTSIANTLSGSGVNQTVNGLITNTDLGLTSGTGNVTISFGNNAISGFVFNYGSGSGTQADPTYQHIGISNIDFTVVPEINPALVSSLLCLLAVGLLHRKNRQRL
jgi:hypothetical protein